MLRRKQVLHAVCSVLYVYIKGSADSYLSKTIRTNIIIRTNKISETNVGSNNIQNKNIEIESAENEITVVKVNETFITDICTATRKKKEDIRTGGNREHGELGRKNYNGGTVRKLVS